MIQLSKEILARYCTAHPEGLLSLIRPVLVHRQKLYERYCRKKTPYELMNGAGKIEPFEYYIVKMAQGYLAGKAPSYRVNGKKKYTKAFTDTIERIRRYNDDGATFSDLMHDYLTTAAAYLYTYENEDNEIVYTRFDPRQTAAIFDYSVPANLIAVVRVWTEDGDTDGEILEIITDTERVRWQNGKRTVEEELHWGDVPCAAAEEPDGIAIFEPALSSIGTYEQMVTNLASMTQYNDNAKLLLVGYTIPEDAYTVDENGQTVANPKRTEYETKLYKAKVLEVGPDGDIRWLLKDVDYSGMLDVLKQRHENITMLTGVPNMTDEAFSSADNASALGYKLYVLDQYSSCADRLFRKMYLRLWEIIVNRLNLRGASFDFRDIDVVMQRNLPTDRDKSIDRAVKMKNSGLFADETCVAESQVEVDPSDERKKLEEQESAEYERMKARSAEAVMDDDGA